MPLEVSLPDEARGPVRQLRDPAVYGEGEQSISCTIAGESKLAICEVERKVGVGALGEAFVMVLGTRLTPED